MNENTYTINSREEFKEFCCSVMPEVCYNDTVIINGVHYYQVAFQKGKGLIYKDLNAQIFYDKFSIGPRSVTISLAATATLPREEFTFKKIKTDLSTRYQSIYSSNNHVDTNSTLVTQTDLTSALQGILLNGINQQQH